MEFAVEKKALYHQQAYDLLREAILKHKLTAEDRITENSLSHQMQISRSPIREAIRMLERDNLLIRTENGLSVNPLPPEEVEELYVCRMMLESFAAKLAMPHITDKQIDYLASCILSSEQALMSGDKQGAVQWNTAFHELIVEASGNRHLQALYNNIRDLTTLSRSNELFSRTDSNYTSDHETILEAFRLRDAELAEQRMRKHIENDLDYYKTHIA